MGRYLLLAKQIELAPEGEEEAECFGNVFPVLPLLESGATFAVVTHNDRSTEKAPRATNLPGDVPCHACGRRAWWLSIHGAVVCGRCHPPPAPDVLAKWLGDLDA